MKYYYAALLAVLFALFGCNTSVVRNSLSRAEGLMAESPDSAKTVLDSIKRSDLKNRALKARFALLYSQAMDKCYIDTDNDSLISVALNYYSKRGSNHEKALAYYYNSIIFTNQNNIEATIENLVKAQEYAEKTLKELSSLEYSITYTHGYCPVRIGDCVRLNYSRAGIYNVKAKVISQNIKCESGCPVTEKAVFTTELWG